MSALAPLATVAALMAATLGGMVVLRRVARARGWAAEVQRKIVHVGAGTLAMALPWIFPQTWPAFVLLALTGLAMLALRLPALSGLGGTLHDVDRRSWGDLLLVASVALLLLLYRGEPILYVLPLAILTVSDAAAALAGSAYGRHTFAVEEGRKSWEGTVMFFLVTLIVAMVALLLLSEVPRVSVIVIAVALAAFATLVEMDSWRGFDNLFLPMGALIFLERALVTPAPDLALSTAAFLAGIALFGVLAARLGISAQSARASGMAVFLMLSVTAPQNVILPTLLIAARLLAGGGEGERFPGLDTVAAIGLMGFGFLAAGQVTGLNALPFFGLACAGAAAVHLGRGLGATELPVWARAGYALGAGLVLWAIWSGVQALNPPGVAQSAALWLTAAALPALLGLAAAAQPAAFAPRPALRAVLVAALPVAALYAMLVLLERLP